VIIAAWRDLVTAQIGAAIRYAHNAFSTSVVAAVARQLPPERSLGRCFIAKTLSWRSRELGAARHLRSVNGAGNAAFPKRKPS
jgi:hypothetical protein